MIDGQRLVADTDLHTARKRPARWHGSSATRPYSAPARRICSVSSTVKNPWSQKTSTNSASFSLPTAGIISRQIRSTYSCWRPFIGPAYGMSSEESGTDGDRRSFADATDHPQHLEFILGRKTVAALDLDAARTHCDNLADTFHRLLVKLVLGSFVQAVGGIQDAAAPLGDLFVAQAVDLVQELLFAASGINQMGMRIAERREKACLPPHRRLPCRGATSGILSIVPYAAIRSPSASSQALSISPSTFMSRPLTRRRPLSSTPTILAMFLTSNITISRFEGISPKRRSTCTSPDRSRRTAHAYGKLPADPRWASKNAADGGTRGPVPH